ncbi:sensor histidine kinase [Dactylosporangium salmoneum]|uniref:histidine kinase n=1 Tax=Dactylosporangium salmoneum TaxID=53361 RepID=A0ABN3GWH8_9ACTN
MIDLRRYRDGALALAIVVASVVPVLRGHGTQVGDLPTRPLDAAALAVIALECLPLVVRRRWPAVCLALTGAGFAVDQLLAYHLASGLALPIALFSAGAHLRRHRRAVAAAASAAYLPLAVALDRLGATEGVTGFATFYLVLTIPWFVGAWQRRAREAEAAATRAAERARIARDLHDVVTHHVTAMVVQAEAARYLTAAPDRLDAALAAVSDTGRGAIADLRHLLDLLNPEHGGELDALVEQARRSGQPVEFTQDGTPRSSVVLYRVVQEALTNAMKYAHGRPTAVRVQHGPAEAHVWISTEGPSVQHIGGGGRGLAGLRERVEALGGDFRAGPEPEGFVVSARIPA